MFHTVLVANRGEIARRIIRTLTTLGIESVAVYSEGDRGSAHVREATRSICIGPDPASTSYLRVIAIIEAALKSGAEAIHPGYGFLSESVELAEACAQNGIVFIGPGTHALEVMGDKVRAREHLANAGVPEVPGFSDTPRVGPRLTDSEIADRAATLGYPLLVKPSAGGGGKGMEVVRSADELADALSSARRVAKASFGDDTMLLERLIERPRHIEVQIFGTSTGEMLALGERECTLQRRHQKVIEESPHAGGISSATIEALLLAAVRAASSVDYVGAGTVEFLVDADRPDEFFFIEMNTRLQVEHPVTEAVLGLDLVELQVRTAAGENILGRLDTQHSLGRIVDNQLGESVGWRLDPQGHAVEARVYAESPERGFLPSVGDILMFEAPHEARVDAALETGDSVSVAYDPMIAKIITHADTREEALHLLDRALAETTVLGVDTNVSFLRQLLADHRVREGTLDTGLIDTLLPVTSSVPPAEVLQAVATAFAGFTQKTERPGWASTLWRSRSATHTMTLLDSEGNEYSTTPGHTEDVTLAIDDALDNTTVWAAHEGASWNFTHLSRREQTLRRLTHVGREAATQCTAPMPGSVTQLHVSDGESVATGQPLVSIEAMKMEHPVNAPYSGIVRVLVEQGEQVSRGQELAVVERTEEGAA